MMSLRVARNLLIALFACVAGLLPVAVLAPFSVTLGSLRLGALGTVPWGVVGGIVPWLLVTLVTGIGAVVAAYSARNLLGQNRLRRFAVLEVVAVTALASAVVAPSLVQLALGWTVGGLAVAGLVGHADTPAARRSSRVVAVRLLVGDVALWAAVVVTAVELGTVRLDALGAAVSAASPGMVTILALLVVLAAVARSALVPMHRWLPETAEAPSPVSAMLHAGLVNGVGVLGLLLWPVVSASLAARGLLLGLAVATALLGTALVRTRPDVKGRLAASTTAQMGYLGVQVALGLPAAVLAHLVGHGMWKASMFLGAGGAVERARHGVNPPSQASGRHTWVSLMAAVLVVVGAAMVPGPWGATLLVGPAAALPVVLAAAALAAALLGARRLGTRAHAVASVGAVLAVVAYLLGLRALTTATESLLSPATPTWGEPGAVAVGVLVVVLLGVGASFWWLDRLARAGGARRVVDAVAAVSLPPRTLRQLTMPAAGVDPDVATAATSAPSTDQVARTRALLLAASDIVSPAWPLESFVASNPLASLEGLEFHDALALASRTWGSATGPSADLFDRALEAGRIDDESLARGCASLLGGRQPLVGDVALVDVVRAVLVNDSGPAVSQAAATPAYVNLLISRVYGDASWPTARGGVWAAARADAALDLGLGVSGARTLALSLPADPLAAVAVMLEQHDGSGDSQVAVLGRLLTDRAGWAAHIAWRLRQGVVLPVATSADPAVATTDAYADLVSVGLLASLIHGETRPAAAPPRPHVDPQTILNRLGVDVARVAEADLADLTAFIGLVVAYGVPRLRLEVWEAAVRRPLMESVQSRASTLIGGTGGIGGSARTLGGPDAQVVLCIDVRSERLRRHLEATGPWETYGAAGFFGLPLTHVSPTGAVSERCPVLIRPDHTVREAVSVRRWSWSTAELSDALHGAEARPFTPFTLAEGSGWVLGPLAALRTAAPSWWARRAGSLRRSAGAPTRGTLAVVTPTDVAASSSYTTAPHVHEGFARPELVDLAAAFLRSTGLVELAPVVVLCGHEGAATNNPHLAAYDCGACGGRSGDVSARAMVQALSDPRVVAGLLELGLDVRGTAFVAAVHDTTRDRVTLLDVDVEAGSTLARLAADLDLASDAVARDRTQDLPQADPTTSVARRRRHLDRRAADWAQVRPEWGLAGNTAMVIGPRSLTAGSNLAGRVFLQSYRPDIDPDGELLESLMAGPLVVAQWISTAYWCSTVDPERFGAGDKTTHNIVIGAQGTEHALSGVLTGVRGDLRVGLPWQAVSAYAPFDGRWSGLPKHDPVRLLAIVCASPATVDAVLVRQPQLARLVLGGWISLEVIDPADGRLQRLDPEHGWVDDPTRPGSIDLSGDRTDALASE